MINSIYPFSFLIILFTGYNMNCFNVLRINTDFITFTAIFSQLNIKHQFIYMKKSYV